MVDEIEDEAVRLLRDGRSDEDVERLTGLDAAGVLALRAGAASGPARPHVRDGTIRSPWA